MLPKLQLLSERRSRLAHTTQHVQKSWSKSSELQVEKVSKKREGEDGDGDDDDKEEEEDAKQDEDGDENEDENEDEEKQDKRLILRWRQFNSSKTTRLSTPSWFLEMENVQPVWRTNSIIPVCDRPIPSLHQTVPNLLPFL